MKPPHLRGLRDRALRVPEACQLTGRDDAVLPGRELSQPAMPSPMSLVAHRATKDMGLSISPPWILFSLAVEAGDGAAVDLFGALKRRRVDRVEEGSALGAARRRDRGDAFVVFRFRDRRDAGMTAAALDRVVFDAVAGIDHV